jgi:hypothetical protein
MTADQGAFVSRCLLVLAPLALIGWDLYAYLRWGRAATESHAMYCWSLRWKGFALAVMLAASFLMWHFFVG